jgi:hypothetical protein
MPGPTTNGNPRTVPPGTITKLLHKASAGDPEATDELIRNIEKELRKIASIHMRRERPNYTLQATAVMNEAVLRLLGSNSKAPADSRG